MQFLPARTEDEKERVRRSEVRVGRRARCIFKLLILLEGDAMSER